MKHFPWEVKLSPEEEQKVYQEALKWKPAVMGFRCLARTLTVLFFIWFFSGFFSCYLVFSFSPGNILLLSLICLLFHGVSTTLARTQIEITGVKKLDRGNDLAVFYRNARIESLCFVFLHGGIGLIANFCQL